MEVAAPDKVQFEYLRISRRYPNEFAKTYGGQLKYP
jgi:hypothetical protein